MAFLDILEAMGLRGGGARIVPPVPEGRVVAVPPVEAGPIDRPPSEAAPLALFICYRDSAGRVSQRRITCRKVESDKGNLLAYCHERGAFRCFKLSRISEAVIAATGEVIDVSDLVEALPESAGRIGDRTLLRLLTVLVFTMKCDGQAHPSERAEIEQAAAVYALRFEKDEDVAARSARTAMGLAPDVEDAVAALRWIEGRPEGKRLAQLLLPFIERVIVADGKIASQEAYFGGMIGDALKAIMAGHPAF